MTIQCSNQDKMKDICQRYANKIEKNIKSLLFLYGGNQLNFELSFNDQANFMDKADNEMKILVYKNQNEFNENDNKLNSLNEKMNDANEEKEKKIKKINDEIYELNQNNISKFITNINGGDRIITLREIIFKELKRLNDLEKNYNFLSSIGIKLLLKHINNEIEGFIKAPDNSPYKNGIFKFIIKIPNDYPHASPRIYFKTKIFHTEVHDDGHCCMRLLNEWNVHDDLSLVLLSLFQFFFNNNENGYQNEATAIYRTNQFNKFEQKCQEYTKKYATTKFDELSEYLFQDFYENQKKFDDSSYVFYDTLRKCANKLEIRGIIKYETLEERFNRKINSSNTVLIAGNKVYYHLNNYKELLKNHIIFIAPDLRNNSKYY